MNFYSRLPLFPLMTVLFPGQILRLHIFEDRYHQMIQECLAGEGVFGVALIRKGVEGGGPAELYRIGVTSRIHECNMLEDGSMDVVCSGKKRFLIHSSSEEQAYMTCDAELWPWSYNPERDDPLASKLKTNLDLYLHTLASIIGGDFPIPEYLPVDTFNLACLAAISLRIPEREKQHLLSTPTLTRLARDCGVLLRRETLLIDKAAAFPDGISPNPQFLSPN